MDWKIYILAGQKSRPGNYCFKQKPAHSTAPTKNCFRRIKFPEDVDAAFFDADRDGDLDLYVVSGGNEYSMQAPAILDRLYINDGREISLSPPVRFPNFMLAALALLPAILMATAIWIYSSAAAAFPGNME